LAVTQGITSPPPVVSPPLVPSVPTPVLPTPVLPPEVALAPVLSLVVVTGLLVAPVLSVWPTLPAVVGSLPLLPVPVPVPAVALVVPALAVIVVGPALVSSVFPPPEPLQAPSSANVPTRLKVEKKSCNRMRRGLPELSGARSRPTHAPAALADETPRFARSLAQHACQGRPRW
jgi:hypothetical protein